VELEWLWVVVVGEGEGRRVMSSREVVGRREKEESSWEREVCAGIVECGWKSEGWRGRGKLVENKHGVQI